MKIGTRKSPLALKQADEVVHGLLKFYPGLEFEVLGIDTPGDKDKLASLSELEGTDFFTREIEQELLSGRIDFAVHSAKDLPDKIPDGLTIAAFTKPLDPYDALVSKNNRTIEALLPGASIGASSLRRKTQLKQYRQDFIVTDIRGNIGERLRKLEDSDLSAIIVAACALMRLGIEDRIIQRVPFEILRPHPLQGSLAIETRKDSGELINLLKVLHYQ